MYRSRVFPGLWIDGPALLSRKRKPLLAALRQGLASPEHAEFLRHLRVQYKTRPGDAP